MAFTRANLVLIASVPSGLNDATTTTDNGFGGTATRQTEPHKIWAYAENAALTDMDAAGYFADAGSTSGDSSLKAGDIILLFGSDGSGVAYVGDAAAGTIYAGRASAGGGASAVFA